MTSCPLVVAMVERMGINALRVLDDIKGHASEKRVLRTVFYGLMRHQAMLTEAVLALKVKHEGLKL